MHLDASGLLVVDGEVLKLPKIEISFESPVDAPEDCG
jgi:hypothetical protein